MKSLRSLLVVTAAPLVAAAGIAFGDGCGFSAVGVVGEEASLPSLPADASTDTLPVLPRDAEVDGEADVLTPACTEPALGFDGVDDWAVVPDDAALDLAGDFTVEAWIKPGAAVTTGAEMHIVSHHDFDASRGWVLRLVGGRAEVVVYGTEALALKGYSAGNSVGQTAYVVPGKWAHVAGTLSGATLRIYYDGVLRDTQEIGVGFQRLVYMNPLRFGRAAWKGDFCYQGELDDVRLSSVARYVGPTAPKPTATVAIDATTVAAWRFDEPSGDVLRDATANERNGKLAEPAATPARVAATCIVSR